MCIGYWIDTVCVQNNTSPEYRKRRFIKSKEKYVQNDYEAIKWKLISTNYSIIFKKRFP